MTDDECREIMQAETYPQWYVDALNSEISDLRAELRELDQMGYRDGQKLATENNRLRATQAGLDGADNVISALHALNRRMREFIYAYFIDGVLRFGDRDGKPWTYREEAREILSLPIEPRSRAASAELYMAGRLDVEKIVMPALKATYARGHYCDMGEKCPGCMAGSALEKITGRKWTQEECE